ncbi:MAG: V-type ATP synthase subunit E [bacterium]
MANTKILKERLISEAENEAVEICERAETEAGEIISVAEQEAEKTKKSILREAEKEASDIKEREKVIASLEQRKAVLAAKQEEVNEVFATALDEIRELEALDYDSLIEDMILAEVKTGNEKIIFNSADKKKFGKKFVDSLNKKLEGDDREGNLSLAKETRDISGGFILKEKGVENNNSFEALLAMKRDDLENGVAEILFD